MKQVLQDLHTGSTLVENVPRPRVSRGQLLIATEVSLLSAGTERMLVDFGKANVIDKARQQPEKVRQVFDKVRTEGVTPTIRAVRNKLDIPLPMGYANAGVVIEIGEGVTGFVNGDRIVSNGNHAEVVQVSPNLCAKMPDGASYEQAAFTVLGAIALQGIRLVQPTLGETVVVTGLGLIGLLTVQLLRAHGCRVLGIDVAPDRTALAKTFGAETVDLSSSADPVATAQTFSRGRGVDAVIITASTKSSEPVHQAALMCRKRGRIVLVGMTGLELSRADFYEKELSFQVSCSYGPGRYDQEYEEKGHDYPVGFVRWTEQRNFEAFLDMLAEGRIDIEPLISHRFPIERAADAYGLITSGNSSLGVLLEYPGEREADQSEAQQVLLPTPLGEREKTQAGDLTIGFIGAGNYASQILIPAFANTKARLKSVASATGVSSVHVGRKNGIERATTDAMAVIADDDINLIVITTRHDSHARFVCAALDAGKHVFVEKPLALTRDELTTIQQAYLGAARNCEGKAPRIMVGFNRRFASQVQKMKSLLEAIPEPKALVMTINAGAVPLDHWTQDPTVGGGRILGEGCHFIDLLRFLVGAPIVSVQATRLGQSQGGRSADDNVSFTLRFSDGSCGTVHYLANGHRSVPKERLEVFCAGRILQLDNFRRLRGFGWTRFKRMHLWKQDKGNQAGVNAFVESICQGGPAPIHFEELIEVTEVSFTVLDALHANGTPIQVVKSALPVPPATALSD